MMIKTTSDISSVNNNHSVTLVVSSVINNHHGPTYPFIKQSPGCLQLVDVIRIVRTLGIRKSKLNNH